jgi:N-acetylglucosaminyldiphosphoundecaprenol N-acetyl-beta-D-mannosaminyltransferase
MIDQAEPLAPAALDTATIPEARLAPSPSGLPSRRILDMRVDATSYAGATDIIVDWAERAEPRYVCVATVHMVMEAYDDPDFRRIVNAADLVTSDGMPLVWGLRMLGLRSATRVYGPDLTPIVCERAARDGIPVGFYGSSEAVLSTMVGKLQEAYPALQVVYRHSPPFRQLADMEVEEEIQALRDSGARIIFVGLGCPKQERWMQARRGAVDAVMLGVGAAFDYVAGSKAQAPDWVQSLGLEWLFRMVTEPRRLWRRYLYNNPRFLGHFGAQLIRTYTRREKS